jgi:dUTP pyrophosphatase
MKQKILVKRINPSLELPKIIKKGDWVDLRCSETTRFKAPQSGTLKSRNVNGEQEKYRNVTFDIKLIPLGVAMQLPDGMEAIVTSRSSTPIGMGISCINSIGIIDSNAEGLGYNGPNDEWKYPAIAWRDTTITEGERICQFRVQLSQKAKFWHKLKWFFSNGIKIVEVQELNNANRGGIGATGKV